MPTTAIRVWNCNCQTENSVKRVHCCVMDYTWCYSARGSWVQSISRSSTFYIHYKLPCKCFPLKLCKHTAKSLYKWQEELPAPANTSLGLDPFWLAMLIVTELLYTHTQFSNNKDLKNLVNLNTTTGSWENRFCCCDVKELTFWK